MSEVQIAIIDEQDTQITLAVPGVQGPSGAISSGGSANQVFYKVSGTNYDAAWTFIGNANVDAAAAIAGTKISPNFGSQATVTTGTNTAASFIPTSATIPSNGIYLPGANQVGVATNGVARLTTSTTAVSSSLAIDHPLGAEATPSITFTGDLNTGFYSPAADTLAAVTAGSNRLHITSGGLVGIGTSSVSELLQVSKTGGANIQVDSGSSNVVAKFGASGAGAFVGSTSNDYFQIYSNNTARIHVTSAGLVGIGSTGPDANSQLHIVGSSYQPLYVNTTSAGGGGAVFFRSGTQALVVGTAGSSWLTGSSTADGLIRSEANLIFATGGNNQRAQIDSSGRLLVGTSTSRSTYNAGDAPKFQVESVTAGATVGIIFNSDNANSSELYLAKARGSDVNSHTIVQNNDNLGILFFGGADGTNIIRGASVGAQVEGTVGANRMPGRLIFSTATDASPSVLTERMRIHNDGRISTGTTSAPGAALFGFSINRTGSQGLLECYRNVGNNAQTAIIGGSAGEAYIEGDGDLKNTNNSYGAISDQKLKENIVDASSQWVDIKTLQVRRYNFKEETGYNTHTQIGLVAQEVELVSPGLVNESPDRDEDGNDLGTVTKSVNYSVLYMKAVKALQEAMERIETLEQRLTAAGID